MKLTDYIKWMVRNYFIIFAIIVITLTILRQIFAPELYIQIKDIYIYMICAFISILPGFILYSPKELSEKERRIRIVLHFIAIEAVIIILANVTGWVTGGIKSFFLSIQVLGIYLLVRLLNWFDDRQTANKINEKLSLMKNDLREIPKE